MTKWDQFFYIKNKGIDMDREMNGLNAHCQSENKGAWGCTQA